MSPHGDREWTGEPSQPTPLPAQTPFTVGDELPILTLDEAGVERLAAAIYGMPGMGATMDSTRKLARAIVEELRRE